MMRLRNTYSFPFNLTSAIFFLFRMSNELKSSGQDYGSFCSAAAEERAGGPPLALGKGGSLPTSFTPHHQQTDHTDNSFRYGVRTGFSFIIFISHNLSSRLI
jgi:hypothetical protein